ncbi:MAG: hypothetical protein UV18_C0013G0031 [Candidatus Magasanikbacteria bacterium GW2011_GWC2_42_27]|nr:MAG: hypothetical protein UV18_C0013G0031 [Candidatus Magasanikbacteria bacterium GW2011_GWC2_42_27]KKT25290.1 MAG: hypothetical protein UW10_C0010G0035 [Candidatus Magasanikbacteria bacterium GW2011_GWA2_43_9]
MLSERTQVADLAAEVVRPVAPTGLREEEALDDRRRQVLCASHRRNGHRDDDYSTPPFPHCEGEDGHRLENELAVGIFFVFHGHCVLSDRGFGSRTVPHVASCPSAFEVCALLHWLHYGTASSRGAS